MHEVKLLGLDLDLLVALDALLDTGSVSGAAARLHRSQPAVSRMLGRLRDLFADPLFVPHGRGLAPTPRALALRGPLKLTLGEVAQLVNPPRAFDPASDTAHFRVLSSDYASVTLMGAVASWLHRHAPGVTLSLLPVTGQPEQVLASGGADLFFGPQALCPAWCASAPFIDDPWMCVRRGGESMPASLADYLALDHVGVDLEGAFGSQVDASLRGRGKARRITLTVPDFAAAMFVVATSPLVATVPRPLASAAAALLALQTAEVPVVIPASTISMIWPRRLDSEPSHVWLRQAVRDSAGRA
jgi:DNA-binding transcriptional LysR family regulator